MGVGVSLSYNGISAIMFNGIPIYFLCISARLSGFFGTFFSPYARIILDFYRVLYDAKEKEKEKK